MGGMFSTNPETQARCATCKDWAGDARLQRGGNREGEIAYEYGVEGKCERHNRITPSSADCRNYRISAKAYELV